MSNLFQSKQIEKFTIGRLGSSGFSGAGTSDVVTTAITTAAGTDNVPVQVATATTLGFITTGANNKVLILDSTSKAAIDDGAGNEIYGRLTEAAGVYTLSYYSLVVGVETAYVLPATTIDFFVNYNYSFEKLPADILVRINTAIVGEDPKNSDGRPIRNEKVNVTGLNILADLAFLPITNSLALYVNGKAESEGASEGFTRVGKVLTWDATDAKYNLETTDTVIAHYNTLEA
jgi:hypothetical protein